MSLRNYIDENEYAQALGIDSTSPLSMIQPGYVQDARNCDIGLSGGYQKRSGYANQLSTPWGSRSITGGIEYKDSSSALHTILFGVDTTDGRIGSASGGSVTSLLTGLNKSARPGFVQFRDLLLFFNGVDTPQVYDGTNFRQMGITAPAAAPTISSQTTGGSLTELGSYVFAYTYYNSVTGAESSPSAVTSPTVLTGTNNKIVLTLVAGSSTTADTIRVWRTVANGNQLFLEGTAAISTTTYNSTVADSGLTTAMELDNTRITILSSTAKYPTVAQNRVFLKTDKNQIRASKFGQSGPMPESYEVKQVVTTMGRFGNNDDIVGINSAFDTPIVLKERSIGRLDPVGIPDQTSSIDNVIYNYTEISTVTGAVSHWAAVQVHGELVFLARDNVYATDGQRVRPVADTFQATIRALGFTSSQVNNISCENNVKTRQIYFTVYENGIATAPAYILVGDYKHYPDFHWTWYTPGTNTSTHPGVRAACMFTVTNTTDGSRDVVFGNVDSNGKYYLMNSGNNDDGLGIYFKLVSRPYSMKMPLNIKLFKDNLSHVQGNGDTYDLTVASIFDLSGSEEDSISFDLGSSGAEWDIALWDVDSWVDTSVLIHKYVVQRKARFWQMVYYQTDANAPVSMLGWGNTASLYKVF